MFFLLILVSIIFDLVKGFVLGNIASLLSKKTIKNTWVTQLHS